MRPKANAQSQRTGAQAASQPLGAKKDKNGSKIKTYGSNWLKIK